MTNHLVSLCTSKAAWPGIIFIFFMIVVLLCVWFSSIDEGQRIWWFLVALIFAIFWALIIYWFCMLSYHAIGWFLLLLPIVIYLTWKLSIPLAKATTVEDCVLGSNKFTFILPNNK